MLKLSRRMYLVEIIQRKLLESGASTQQIRKSTECVVEAEAHAEAKKQQRVIKLAVLGIPNAGKSTFINNLVDHQICATSSRMHTTRRTARAFTNHGQTQIICVDTPGVVSYAETKKFHLDAAFGRDLTSGVGDAHVIGVVHDASNHWKRYTLDSRIVNILKEYRHVPSVLILNKIDLLKSKRKLLDVIDKLTDNCIDGVHVKGPAEHALVTQPIKGNEPNKWRHFSHVFMISSLNGDGVERVKDYLVAMSKEQKWLFDSEYCTDQPPKIVIENTVKAALLDFLPQEIPYKLHLQLEYFHMNEDGSIRCAVQVKCPSKRLETLIRGVSDGRARQINALAQRNLWRAFYCPVILQIQYVSPVDH